MSARTIDPLTTYPTEALARVREHRRPRGSDDGNARRPLGPRVGVAGGARQGVNAGRRHQGRRHQRVEGDVAHAEGGNVDHRLHCPAIVAFQGGPSVGLVRREDGELRGRGAHRAREDDSIYERAWASGRTPARWIAVRLAEHDLRHRSGYRQWAAPTSFGFGAAEPAGALHAPGWAADTGSPRTPSHWRGDRPRIGRRSSTDGIFRTCDRCTAAPWGILRLSCRTGCTRQRRALARRSTRPSRNTARDRSDRRRPRPVLRDRDVGRVLAPGACFSQVPTEWPRPRGRSRRSARPARPRPRRLPDVWPRP